MNKKTISFSLNEWFNSDYLSQRHDEAYCKACNLNEMFFTRSFKPKLETLISRERVDGEIKCKVIINPKVIFDANN